MTHGTDIRLELDRRFNLSLLGLSKAKIIENVGAVVSPEIKPWEPFDAQRQLLRVEQQARRDTALIKRSEVNYVNTIRQQLNSVIFERIVTQFEAPTTIQTDVLSLPKTFCELLDGTSVRAASIAKLAPLIEQTPWLAATMLKLVNTSEHRKTDRLGKVIVVKNLRMALSFIGMENLKLVIPAKAFKHAIPKITDPYPEFKNRIWEHALGSALAAKQLATFYQVNPDHAFTLGILHELGTLALTKLYFQIFDEVHQEAKLDAYQKHARYVNSALMRIEPSATTLASLIEKYSPHQSSNIINNFGLQRVVIGHAMREYADKPAIANMSPLCKTLLHATGYSKFLMLRRYKLIDTQEAKMFIKALQMTTPTFRALQATDITKLDLLAEETQAK